MNFVLIARIFLEMYRELYNSLKEKQNLLNLLKS